MNKQTHVVNLVIFSISIIVIGLSLYSNVGLLTQILDIGEYDLMNTAFADHVDTVRILTIITAGMSVFALVWNLTKSRVPTSALVAGVIAAAGVNYVGDYLIDEYPAQLSDAEANTLIKRVFVTQYAALAPQQMVDDTVLRSYFLSADRSNDLYDNLSTGEHIDLYLGLLPVDRRERTLNRLRSNLLTLSVNEAGQEALQDGEVSIEQLSFNLASQFTSIGRMGDFVLEAVSNTSALHFNRIVSAINVSNADTSDSGHRFDLQQLIGTHVGIYTGPLGVGDFCNRRECSANYGRAAFASELTSVLKQQMGIESQNTDFDQFITSLLGSFPGDTAEAIVLAAIVSNGSVALESLSGVELQSSTSVIDDLALLDTDPLNFILDSSESIGRVELKQVAFLLTIVPLLIFALTILSVGISAFIVTRLVVDFWMDRYGLAIRGLPSSIALALITIAALILYTGVQSETIGPALVGELILAVEMMLI